MLIVFFAIRDYDSTRSSLDHYVNMRLSYGLRDCYRQLVNDGVTADTTTTLEECEEDASAQVVTDLADSGGFTIQRRVRLPQELWDAVDLLGRLQGCSASVVIRAAVEGLIDKEVNRD